MMCPTSRVGGGQAEHVWPSSWGYLLGPEQVGLWRVLAASRPGTLLGLLLPQLIPPWLAAYAALQA